MSVIDRSEAVGLRGSCAQSFRSSYFVGSAGAIYFMVQMGAFGYLKRAILIIIPWKQT